jgi:exopolysaccharide biosynthesis polyprenyl glycosylphosphotransferase
MLRLRVAPRERAAVRVRHGAYCRLKRGLDIFLSLVLVALLSPLLVFIALCIKSRSPGPVLFRQNRVGKDGKPFTVLKFRSMRQDSDPRVHQQYVTNLIQNAVSPTGEFGTLKMTQDSRVTGLGRTLRRFSLDELPQLVNVLRGEMSLVGPRPHLPYEVELYEEWQRSRLAALPGITGWWQVKGRNRVSFDELVRMDIWYIKNMSLWLDLKILLLTPFEALRGKGAG